MLAQGTKHVFEIGDLIRHKRSGECFLVIDINIYLNRNIERVEYKVLPVGAGGGVHMRLHHPLMTVNYEKVA